MPDQFKRARAWRCVQSTRSPTCELPPASTGCSPVKAFTALMVGLGAMLSLQSWATCLSAERFVERKQRLPPFYLNSPRRALGYTFREFFRPSLNGLRLSPVSEAPGRPKFSTVAKRPTTSNLFEPLFRGGLFGGRRTRLGRRPFSDGPKFPSARAVPGRRHRWAV